MLRHNVPVRRDLDQIAADNGFDFHIIDNEIYWDESRAYRFTLRQIEEQIEKPTAELHQMCLEVVDRAVKDEEILTQLAIPPLYWDVIAESWRARDPSLYGRMDFAWCGNAPVKLLAIDSPTGYTAEAEEFVLREFRALGFAAERTAKGGILIDLGGESTDDALLLEAHADTLGGMVAEIKGDGRLRIVNVGGMNANNAEAENCRVVPKFSGSYEGTLQLINASVHVNGDYASTKRSWDTVEVVLDEAVESADDVKALGISVGDFVCFERAPA